MIQIFVEEATSAHLRTPTCAMWQAKPPLPTMPIAGRAGGSSFYERGCKRESGSRSLA